MALLALLLAAGHTVNSGMQETPVTGPPSVSVTEPIPAEADISPTPTSTPTPIITGVEISFDFDRASTSASNQYAIWMENDAGKLVKTITVTNFTAARRGYRNRDTSLPAWVFAAGPESISDAQIDAVSSATMSSGRLAWTWDLTNDSGARVPDGIYTIKVEGKNHAKGGRNWFMNVRDMTVGDPLRHILAFSLPTLIGNLFQQVYSLVDTMVAGHVLGDGAIAAIGAVSSLYAFLIDLAWGMNNGFSLVVTRAFGAHDDGQMRKAIAGTMVLDCVVTAALMVLSLLFLRPLVGLMNTPETIFADAHAYMLVLCLGMLGTIGFNMFMYFLRAMGNSVTPLYALIVCNVLNVGLDVLFVAGFRWGVTGAAAATVVAELCASAYTGVYFFRHYQPILPHREDFRISADLLKNLLSNGLAMAFMYSVVNLGSVFFQGANNKLSETLGEGIITAHIAARRIISLMMTPLGCISSAGSTFIAQNWGAKKKSRIRDGIWQEILICTVWSLFACAVVYLFGGALVALITGSSDAGMIANAVLSLRIHLPFYAPLGVFLCLRTTMQAVDIKLPPSISSAMELGMKILAAGLLIPRLGFLGTCVTEPVTWVLCAIFLTVVYFSKRKSVFFDEGEN